MDPQRAGLFESLRQLFGTALSLAQVRLELLLTDLELEKRRLIDVALLALVGLMLLGLGLALLVVLLVLLVPEAYRPHVVGALVLAALGGGYLLLSAARRRLRRSESLLAATTAELARDRAALGVPE
jgi:uncharacterized membrane protein YqjE